MKKLLFVLLLSPVCGKAQTVPANLSDSVNLAFRNMSYAGLELQAAQRAYVGGIVAGLVGTGAATIGVVTEQPVAIVAGGAVAVVSIIKMVNAFAHIDKAGKYLTPGGIVVPIKSRKRTRFDGDY